jgi:dihydroorotate dehydrogenase electron transfer subunit
MPHSTESGCGSLSQRPPRFEGNVKVLSHRRIVLNEFEIVLYAPEIAMHARPGQFVMLLFGEGYSAAARRPFSLFRVDPDAGTISIFYLARGSFTSELAQKQPGDLIALTGPLGRPFEWFPVQNTRHIMVAGGIGAPPIYFLAREITRWRDANSDAKVTILVINAAKSAELLVGAVEFDLLAIDIRVVTADGSGGQQGLATDVLQQELEMCSVMPEETRIYACGPMAMLRTIGAMGIAEEVSCQLSIETPMPCGIGDCDGCPVRVFDPQASSSYSLAKACWDGPVFEAKRLAWEL